ncbi:hypothetical protein ABI59_09870 [Acidobacteria bacterium Mor1]|nr:hypothetical protein ABI59_09870 [Acidobacteria bacterium Mor1]
MNKLRSLAAELWRRDPVLAAGGWLQLIALAVVAAAAPFDDRTILGINPWIKPAKFMISIAIFLWTTGWLMHHLPGLARTKALIRWGVLVSMLVEIGAITMQSVRGVRSHYNFDTPFDATVFGIMGGFIGLNTLLVGLLWLLFLFRRTELPGPYLLAVRLGLLIFLLASYEGGLLVQNGSHTVGAPDGGPGLPFLNWSLDAGDLRIAHFAGLHAMQLLPLLAWLLAVRFPGWPAARRSLIVTTFALFYAAAGLLLYLQAVAGRPLIPG